MNEELEAAKKKMHDACIEYLRAALKATNSDEIAVLMLAKDFVNLAEDFTEADFADITAKGGAS